MKVRNKVVLASFRTPGHCELCRVWCRAREPLHIIGVGAGGPDHPLNLIAAGSTFQFQCPCHRRLHDTGRPSREELFAIAGRREGVPDAEAAVRRMMLLEIKPWA